jgi:hypothetical protein
MRRGKREEGRGKGGAPVWSVAALLAWSPLTVASAQAGSAPSFPVQAGVTVNPDTVRVGDPFTVIVAVRAPKGATIEFPEAPDSTRTVQALDPRQIVPGSRSDTLFEEQQAVYRVAAWDINQQPVLSGAVIVKLGRLERRVPLGGYSVFVQTVLPEDTTLHVPKPARELFTGIHIPWWVWALLAAVAILLWRLWVWWRNRQPVRHVVYVDPYERAIGEFTRIEALGLLEAGERGRYVALTVDVLRAYLADRFPSAPMSTTSTELLQATRDQRTVLHERLLRVLNEADLIKFAQRSVGLERARELGREARLIVEHEHKASQPPAEGSATATGAPPASAGAAA